MEQLVHSSTKAPVKAPVKATALVKAKAKARAAADTNANPNAKAGAKALSKARASSKLTPSRTNDPARTMAEILKVATHEFADKGLSGARIDAIAEATRTSKRMIYYYYGSKEGLYLAVLEESYRRMRAIEAELHLEDLDPESALRRLVEFTFDHHAGNEDFIRLVMNENIERGTYLQQSTSIQQFNVPAIDAIRSLYLRGVEQGVFRPGLDPVDLHASISALTFFNVSNQHTFGVIFKDRAKTRAQDVVRRANIVDMIVRFAKK